MVPFLPWVCSSVVERYVDIVEVASSILAIPTKNTNYYNFPKANLTIYKKL